MAPPLDPVRSDEALPGRADVVVIGGGIVGAAAAFFLARHGLAVVLCEKGAIGGEQSSRNWGWCRQTLRHPAEIPLIVESLRLWRDRSALGDADTGFRITGITYLCANADDAGRYEAWLDHARQHQLDSRMLSADEMAALLPGGTRRWPGALHTPSDGGAEPQMAAPAIVEAARRAGAAILAGCAARGLERQAGRVCGVVTEKGPIACAAVVLAGGAWSRLFCGNLGLDLPQLKVLASVSRTAPLPGGPALSLSGPGFGFRKRDDGGYIVSQAGAIVADIVPDSFRLFRRFLPAMRAEWKGLRFRLGARFLQEARTPRRWRLDRLTPFERVRMLDPAPTRRALDEAAGNLAAAYPFFADMRIVERWGGLIDVTPDTLPVISAVRNLPGFYLATGFSGHGFGVGPGAGRLIADLVVGAQPLVDPKPFDFARFEGLAA
jgi:glycine/D-amino acid oxidase-like deaminating enzyme